MHCFHHITEALKQIKPCLVEDKVEELIKLLTITANEQCNLYDSPSKSEKIL